MNKRKFMYLGLGFILLSVLLFFGSADQQTMSYITTPVQFHFTISNNEGSTDQIKYYVYYDAYGISDWTEKCGGDVTISPGGTQTYNVPANPSPLWMINKPGPGDTISCKLQLEKDSNILDVQFFDLVVYDSGSGPYDAEIDTFSFSSYLVKPGSSVTMTWETSRSRSCRITTQPDIGDWNVSTSGSMQVTVNENTSFTLIAYPTDVNGHLASRTMHVLVQNEDIIIPDPSNLNGYQQLSIGLFIIGVITIVYSKVPR
jgi:hypothetical protein